MSVVVRMEMPKACEGCWMPSSRCKWRTLAWYLKDDSTVSYRNSRSPFCPIICQLPEGHGRLGDLDALADDVRGLLDYKTVDGITATTVLNQTLTDIRNCPTIVPAERSET